MAAPWQENPHKVVVEFLKSGSGASRLISLKHNGAVLPSQLSGRILPQVWAAFMADIEQAARQHPYVVKPSAGRVGSWLACGALGAVIGCCAINPDGGDYDVWLPQVQSIIDRHQPAFAPGGCQLSLQRAQQSYWVQVDVSPTAVGQPVAGHPPGGYPQAPAPYQQGPSAAAGPYYAQEPHKPGFEAKPGYEPQPGYAAKPGYEGKPPY